MLVMTKSAGEYFATFPKAHCIYGSAVFHEVTPEPETVRHFIGYDEKLRPRMGIAAAFDGKCWQAPWSAPFAEIAYNTPQSLERIYDFISELDTQLATPLRLTLAPAFYDPEMLTRLTGVIGNYGNRIISEYDYYYPLSEFPEYESRIARNARKNLAQARRHKWTFTRTEDIARAYAVIKANRDSHGYNLALSLDRVMETVARIPADFFLLSLEGRDIAAAMVYHAAPGIAQVIYWGDIPGVGDLRPMNMLAREVFAYYHAKGFRIVDVGPSSTNGIPNIGLCSFKESVGCRMALRPTIIIGQRSE